MPILCWALFMLGNPNHLATELCSHCTAWATQPQGSSIHDCWQDPRLFPQPPPSTNTWHLIDSLQLHHRECHACEILRGLTAASTSSLAVSSHLCPPSLATLSCPLSARKPHFEDSTISTCHVQGSGLIMIACKDK